MFVLIGTILQNKISPIECQNQNTLNRVHREAGGQQLRPMPNWKYQQRQSSSSSSSTWWQWSESWWSLPKNSKKVNERGCMQRFTIERCNLLSTDLWVKPRTNGFHEFILLFSICCKFFVYS